MVRRIVIILSLFWISAGYAAKNPESIQGEIADIRKTIEKTDHVLETQKKEASSRKENLATIEKKIADYETEMFKLSSSLASFQQQLTRLEKERDALLARHARSVMLLEKQINQHLKTYKAEQIPFALQIKEWGQWPRLSKLYTLIHQERELSLRQINEDLTSVVEAQKQVETKTLAMRDTLKRMTQVKTALGSQKTKQATMVLSLQRSIETSAQQLTKLKKDEAALNQILNKLHKEAKAAAKQAKKPSPNKKGPTELVTTPVGKWGYPVAKSLFSLERAAFFPQTRYPNFIPLKANTPIQAISAGRVVFSDWLRGLGLLLIVDHGNGTLSLYGNNERLLKKTGESVTPGETIAYSGQTGGIPEAGLYFEIRQNGHLLNPESWFKF